MTTATTPDWDFWANMPDVELWQACALSLNLDPDKFSFSRNGWMAGPGDHGPFVEAESFRDDAEKETFHKRLRLLKANLSKREHFSAGILNMERSYKHHVRLGELSAWAQGIGWTLPAEFPKGHAPTALENQKAVAEAPATETTDQRCARLLGWLREEQATQSRGALARVVRRDGRARSTVSADIDRAKQQEADGASPMAAMVRTIGK